MKKVIAKKDFSINGVSYITGDEIKITDVKKITKLNELGYIEPLSYKELVMRIIEDNARTDHSSNQKQGSVTQKCYKNDDVFEFVNAGRDKLNYKSQVLDIDMWDGTSGSYPAKVSDVIITVTSYMGENAEIEYDIYYDGDSTEGTVTIADGVPTFTPSVSL